MMTDTQRIDWLEKEMKFEPLLLHNLVNLNQLCPPVPRGLGLLQGQRTLREAIDSAAGNP